MIAQSNGVLAGLKSDDYVLIRDADGELLDVGRVSYSNSLKMRIEHYLGSRRDYTISTGKRWGCDGPFAVPASKQEYFDALTVLKAARQAEADQKAAAEKAAYDALPESVKIASRLRFFCDMRTDSEVAEMPIEALRQLDTWIKANYYNYDRSDMKRKNG